VSKQPQQDEGLIAGILRALVPALIIALVIRTMLFQAVSIPSGSMQPTLLIGDDLMVSKFIYGYSRYSLPFGPPLFSGRAFPALPQRGDKFGERLWFAVEDLFKCGFESVCLIDSDSPTVPPANFAQAVKFLKAIGDRVVLGPSQDGGYYLIGLKKFHRELFERIDWSTERVFEQTIERASEIGLDIKCLPRGYDVDDRAGLARLCHELLGQNAADNVAPNTRKFLASIVAQKKL